MLQISISSILLGLRTVDFPNNLYNR